MKQIRRFVSLGSLMLVGSLVAAAQNNCSGSPASGTCPAPAPPVQTWCAGNNSGSTCPGGTSWVGFDTSSPQPGSWSGQFEGLDAASLLAGGITPGKQVVPNGAVGPTDTSGVGQYLQFADGFVQAFDRATGNGIFSEQPNSGALPESFSRLFAPSGQKYCGAGSIDGVAAYDKIDNVFVLANIAHPSSGEHYYCIGVSAASGSAPASNLQGSNGVSNWNAYAYYINPAIPLAPNGIPYFPDYERFGTWSDGFYVSWDLADQSNNYNIVGFEVCQLDKASILAGLSSSSPVCYTYIPSYAVGSGGTDLSLIHTLLPSDFDGGKPIPLSTAGEYFLAQVNPHNPHSNKPCKVKICTSNSLAFWTWSGFVNGAAPTLIKTKKPYTPGCYRKSNPLITYCVPEPYGGFIDSVGDRLMSRLAYRYLNKKETLAVAHTVEENKAMGRTGIRYYRITASNSPAVLYQGDIQDTTTFYFLALPSVAMDKNGVIGIAYTVAGSVNYGGFNNYDPSPYFVTIGANQKAGTPVPILGNSGLSGENETNASWGAYISTTVDPMDDLTFWSVNEYMNGDQIANCPGTGCTWASRVYTCKKSSGC